MIGLSVKYLKKKNIMNTRIIYIDLKIHDFKFILKIISI